MTYTHDLYLHGDHALRYLTSAHARRIDSSFGPYVVGEANYMAYLDGTVDFPPMAALPSSPPAITRQDARSLEELLGVQAPICVCVDSLGLRRNSKRLTCSLHPTSAPQRYFKIGDELHCAAPELALLTVAQCCSDIELIVLMSILMSIFSKGDSPGGKLLPRRALTTPSDIEQFMSRCTMLPGYLPAGSARIGSLLPYAIPRAASPKEIECALRLALPAEMGGCALEKPAMNYKLKLSRSSKSRYCDLYWPDSNVAVEYDSVQEHTGFEALESDALHRNDLTALGVRQFFLTPGQLNNMTLFHRICGQVARALKVKLPPQTPLFHEAQRNLRDDIRAAFQRFGF